MVSQNEIVNGANAAWLGATFVAWLAVIWAYYYGEWRVNENTAGRESASIFLKGACITLFAQWVHRGFWFIYLIQLEAGNHSTLADLIDLRWMTPVLATLGAVGCVMMLFPMLRHLPVNWKLVGALLISALFAFGVWIT